MGYLDEVWTSKDYFRSKIALESRDKKIERKFHARMEIGDLNAGKSVTPSP